MSWTPTSPPICVEDGEGGAIALRIEARARDVGALGVRRVLPSRSRRMVGPFVFFDHMGPAELAPGRGVDIAPHPHIHLATVTYLFEGALDHRDSLGTHQTIRPGAVNWMSAGRGIVHSERSPADVRATGHRLHGLQLWVALPRDDEDGAPSFAHYPAEALPRAEVGRARVGVLAGEAYGQRSPVVTRSRLVYVDAAIPAGERLALPDGYEERAVYVVSGRVHCRDESLERGVMAVFGADAAATLTATEDARVAIIGGDPLEGPRYIDWNFVSSSPERIEAARDDWREGRFPIVPGDEDERIPLP